MKLQQQPLSEQPHEPDAAAPRWQTIGRQIIWLLLCYLVGPGTIASAKQMRDEAAQHYWHADLRWRAVKAAILPSLLWYLPLWFFRETLTALWIWAFAFPDALV